MDDIIIGDDKEEIARLFLGKVFEVKDLGWRTSLA
jgi:hypothetical protein